MTETIDWNEYQAATRKTAIYPGARTIDGLLYVACGLNGEAGEIAEHGKKLLRDDGGTLTPERITKLRKELGDVCWYCAGLGFEAGFKLAGCIVKPVDVPEDGNYPGKGTNRGFLYLALRLNEQAAKVGFYANTVVGYTVPQGKSWLEVGQGVRVAGNISRGVAFVLWYVQELAVLCGTDLDAVMAGNLENLAGRQTRGTLHGDGSSR